MVDIIVNMGENIKQLYLNLNNLLEDICKFLSGEKLHFLSPAEKEVANTLISRSKRQLQEISKIVPKINEEEYVDMSKNYSVKDGGNGPSTDQIVDKTCTTEQEVSKNKCPYVGLKAENASQAIKCGNVWMRRKLILNIEVFKKVYASIHDNWLLIYSNNVDSKPMCFFDLKYCKAREENTDKNSRLFELIDSQCPEKKVCQFSTKAHKDVLQWVYKINECHDRVATAKDDESYDIIEPNFGNSCEEEENIYNEPDMVCHRQESLPTHPDTLKPPLPGRKPSTPPSPDSIHSEVSYHEVMENKHTENGDTEQPYYEPEEVSKSLSHQNDTNLHYESINSELEQKSDQNILKITRKTLFSEWHQRSLETFSSKSNLKTFRAHK